MPIGKSLCFESLDIFGFTISVLFSKAFSESYRISVLLLLFSTGCIPTYLPTYVLFFGLSPLIIFSFGWKWFEISLPRNRKKIGVSKEIWEKSIPVSGGHLEWVWGNAPSSQHRFPVEEKEDQRIIGP